MRRGRRMTRRLTELRLTELERQMSHIEDWTGCHTDEELPDLEDPTVNERLAAQARLIECLIRMLATLWPDFSIESVRKAARMMGETAMEYLDNDVDRRDEERLQRFVEELIPLPPQKATSGGFRPRLVPKEPDEDERH